MHPLLSIIIPTYNRSSTIGRCIKSVIDSPLRSFEIIVVDDCSTDDTGQVINDIEDPQRRVRYYKNYANLGVSGSRNQGLGLAIGRWVCFLDSDDTIIGNCFSVWFQQCLRYDGDAFFAKYKINSLPTEITDYGTQEWVCVNCEKLAMDFMASPVGNSILTYVWAKIYNLEFIRSLGIEFNDDLSVYEDIDFNANLIRQNPRVFVSSIEVYDYSVSSVPQNSPISVPLGFIVALKKYADCIDDRSRSADLMGVACDYFITKSLLIEMRKKNPSFLWRFISLSKERLYSLNYKNIKNPYLRFICKTGFQKNKYSFFIILWIMSSFQKISKHLPH